jgi:ferredoxin
MSHVVTSACFGCKYTDCVVVCPVEAFREGEQMVYIDPDICTSCDACTSECPVEAIYSEDDVPEAERPFIQLNAEMAAISPQITQRRQPLKVPEA